MRLATLAYCVYSVHTQIHFQDDPPDQGDTAAVAQAVHELAGKLYLEEAAVSVNNNIVISPLSIHLTLAMLYYGLKGTPRKEVKTVLGLDNIKRRKHLTEIREMLQSYDKLANDNITLNIANNVFVSDNLIVKQEYSNLVENIFGSEITSLDFSQSMSAIEMINNWVMNKTSCLIPSLVSQDTVDKNTKLLLANAVYYKARWNTPFNEKHTRAGLFRVGQDDRKTVDFMFLSGNLESSFVADLNSTVVAIPYADKQFKMILVHPEDPENIDTIETQLFNNTGTQGIQQYIADLPTTDTDFFLPKFKTGSDISLVQHLQALGVTELFGADANLRGISDGEDIAVSDIIHKTKIEVSEEGSEAAAATAVIFTKVFTRKPRVKIDSPFLFFILDTKTGIPIFTGKIVDPMPGQNIKEKQEEDQHQPTKYKSIVHI